MNPEHLAQHRPQGWRVSTLGECCANFDNYRKPLSESERQKIPGPYPYYGPTGVMDYINEYKLEGKYVLISEDGDHFLKYRSVPMTILTSGKFNVNNHAHVLQGVGDCLTEWVYHYFKHASLQSFITRQGAGRYKLTKATLNRLPILIPPLDEQRAISAILNTWDDALNQTLRLVELKQSFKAGLMESLVLGKLRFPEFPKEALRTEHPYDGFPDDWGYRKIKEIASESSVRNVDGHDIPVLSCSKYDGLVESLKYFGRRVFSEDTSKYKVVQRGQFAYPSNHIEEGSIGLLDFLDAGLVSPIYTVFEVTDEVHAPYLMKVFKTSLYRHFFEVNTSASVDRRGSLRWKQFSEIGVPLPSLAEQVKISDCIDALEEEIKKLLLAADHYQRQKDALMQQLLTGQIRTNAGTEVSI